MRRAAYVLTAQLISAFAVLAGTSPGVPPAVGGGVWIDNVRWRRRSALSYAGPERPLLNYAPEKLLTSWEVLGPFTAINDRIGRYPGSPAHRWRPFAADRRGAVITGTVTTFHGDRTVAYVGRASRRTSRDARCCGSARRTIWGSGSTGDSGGSCRAARRRGTTSRATLSTRGNASRSICRPA